MPQEARNAIGIVYKEDLQNKPVDEDSDEVVRSWYLCLLERHPVHVRISEYSLTEYEYEFDFDGPYVSDSRTIKWTRFAYGPCDGSCKEAVRDGARTETIPEDLAREIPEKLIIWQQARYKNGHWPRRW